MIRGKPKEPEEFRIEFPAKTPTPDEAAMVADEFRRLLGLLKDPGIEALAIAKMEGYTNQEIADKLGCSLRTVERQLNLIRKKWEPKTP